MAYLTDNALRNISDIPISLPSTRVTPNSFVIVASFQISNGVTAEFRSVLLQLISAIQGDTVIDLGDTCNPKDIGLVNSNYGLAYAGIVKDLTGTTIGQNSLQFVGTVNDVLTISNVGIVARESSNPLTIDSNGNYSFVLFNNCLDTDLRLLVSGMVRLQAS